MRFVFRLLSEKEGVDYEEKFTPVTKYTSIWVVISISLYKEWKIHQMDLKTTFQN